MPPQYLDRKRVAALLPMDDCITVMEQTFRSLAAGNTLQPLRTLMWLPDKSGILGMMPGYAKNPDILGIKVITIFHANGALGLPSHQGVVILFDAKQGTPLLILDATEITAIRTAATSALATKLLARKDATHLAILGTGEQAERHIQAISLVRSIDRITIWGRNNDHAETLARKFKNTQIAPTAKEAVSDADIICTVTASREPILYGEWIPEGAHINAVGSCTPATRELDTAAVVHASLFTDRYESLFKEAGDFLIPKQEGAITEDHVKGELGEVLTGTKPGRENSEEITLFKSLGIAAEDLYAAWHIYQNMQKSPPQGGGRLR
jgi:alanine dehydrogenase